MLHNNTKKMSLSPFLKLLNTKQSLPRAENYLARPLEENYIGARLEVSRRLVAG